MNQGQERIPCPRCRSNNFVGGTNCWQCGASLPPPESLASASYAAAYQPPRPVTAAHNSLQACPPPAHQVPGSAGMVSLPGSRPSPAFAGLYLRVALLAVTLIIMLVAAAYYANLGRASAGLDSNTQQALEQLDHMNRSLGEMIDQSQPPISSPAILEPNSVQAQAQREMERLQRQHGLGAPPPVSKDGRVHLQSGGTLSEEEYNRARRSLEPP